MNSFSEWPAIYPITPAAITPDQRDLLTSHIESLFGNGIRIVQLRLPLWTVDETRSLAAALLPGARHNDAVIMLNSDIPGAAELGDNVGTHLRASQLGVAALQHRIPARPIGASCHSARELAVAAHIDADFVTLSPVAETASHPGATPLGWKTFQHLAETSAIPIYALGGLTPDDLPHARRYGAHGVAGIRSFWPDAQE